MDNIKRRLFDDDEQMNKYNEMVEESESEKILAGMEQLNMKDKMDIDKKPQKKYKRSKQQQKLDKEFEQIMEQISNEQLLTGFAQVKIDDNQMDIDEKPAKKTKRGGKKSKSKSKKTKSKSKKTKSKKSKSKSI